MAQEHHIIRVRGLPFSCNESDVTDFFGKCNIQAIHFTKNREGRPSGDAYIEMASLRDVKEGLKNDKKYMGSSMTSQKIKNRKKSRAQKTPNIPVSKRRNIAK